MTNPYSATPAPLPKRFAALVYEGLIMLAVTLVAMIPAAAVALALRSSTPHIEQIGVCLCFLAAWWWYAKLNWRKGQTLAMKAWRLRLCDVNGALPHMARLRSRYLWACVFLVLVPALSYLVLSHISALPPKPRFYLSLVWWLLPWGSALFHPSRQFLYDILAGTQVCAANKRD